MPNDKTEYNLLTMSDQQKDLDTTSQDYHPKTIGSTAGRRLRIPSHPIYDVQDQSQGRTLAH